MINYALKQEVNIDFYHVRTNKGCMLLWSKVEIQRLPEISLKNNKFGGFQPQEHGEHSYVSNEKHENIHQFRAVS